MGRRRPCVAGPYDPMMLAPILEATRHRIAGLPREADLAARTIGLPPARDLVAALAAEGLQVIAEIKRRSPSAGSLAPHLDPGALARRYVAGGAAAVSVLTEPDYFDGSLDDLREVTAAVDVPVLRKDFTLDPRQIWEARLSGADAVLLIVGLLEPRGLTGLLATAEEAGVAALVEVHDAAEAEIALEAGAVIVGVNNRDLRTFRTDVATAVELAAIVAEAPVTVAESGVSTPAAAGRMAASGYDAVLVGEALVTADDPARLVRALRGEP